MNKGLLKFRGYFYGQEAQEKLQKDRDRTKMELLMAEGTPLSRQLDQERVKIETRRQEREFDRMMEPLRLQQAKMYADSVNYLYLHNQISLEEYKKYLLDETGKYKPKLKIK